MATGILEQTENSHLSGEIPVANVLPAAREFPDEQWLNIPNVPVFAEHSTVTRGGRDLAFGRAELAVLCSNCNVRIRETGDYAGIVVGHTPDPDATDGTTSMPLVGLAGPFQLGMIRQPNGKAKWAVLADFHVRRECEEVVRQFPRRSAELWLADSYEDMYLDPIALLGAEAPRLDMGLLYSAVSHRNGRPVQVEKYSACAPSATSVFIPGDDRREDYSEISTPPGMETNTMALTPEDLKQIVDAIEQLDWVQAVKQKLGGEAPPEVNEPPADSIDPPLAPPVGPPSADSPPVAPPLEPESGDDTSLPIKYSRLSGEVNAMRQTVDTLTKQLESERALRVNTERYSALSECRRTRLFDVEQEFEMLKYGKASDEQFTAHVERINTNYREIPLDTSLPTFNLPAATSSSRPGGKQVKERYSKEVSDRALSIAKRKAMNGEAVSYEEVLEQVAAGES